MFDDTRKTEIEKMEQIEKFVNQLTKTRSRMSGLFPHLDLQFLSDRLIQCMAAIQLVRNGLLDMIKEEK